MRTTDVVVVGDGVAANAALITLGVAAPTLDILHVARERDERQCGLGEHLSAPGFAVLKELGLEHSFRAEGHLETHASYSAWGSALLHERNSLTDPHAVGWCVDRGRFDAWLRRQAHERCHPRTLDAPVERARLCEGGVELRLRGGQRLRGGFVLDASGRSAAIARHLTVRRRLDRQVAFYNVFEQVEPAVQPTAGPLVEAMPGGWLYSALRPDRCLVVIWFTDGDLLHSSNAQDTGQPRRAAAFREALAASVYTRKRVETAGFALDRSLLEVPGAVDAGTRLNDAVVGSGWAAVGDAAGAFDPLASHGLSAALWSGRQAASCLVRHVDGEDGALQEYGHGFSRGFDRYQAQRRALYRLERRFNGPFWKRRQSEHALGSREFGNEVETERRGG